MKIAKKNHIKSAATVNFNAASAFFVGFYRFFGFYRFLSVFLYVFVVFYNILLGLLSVNRGGDARAFFKNRGKIIRLIKTGGQSHLTNIQLRVF